MSGARVGLVLSTFDSYGRGIGDLAADATRAEALGFDSVWVGDHLQFNVPMLEAMTVLGAVAAVTERVALGTAVLLAALRPPAWVAKQVATLQHLSAGRLQLGIGVGGEKPAEWESAGVPRAQRGSRTDAVLAALPDLLAGRATRVGAPYAHTVGPLEPAAPMPPVWIGGRSEAALARTVRHRAGWMGAFAGTKLLTAVRDRLDELAAAADRERPALATFVFVHVGDDRARADHAARLLTERQYRVPFQAMDRYIVRGSPAHVLEELASYVRLGYRHLVLLPVDTEPRRQYEPLADLRRRLQVELAPRTRSGP